MNANAASWEGKSGEREVLEWRKASRKEGEES